MIFITFKVWISNTYMQKTSSTFQFFVMINVQHHQDMGVFICIIIIQISMLKKKLTLLTNVLQL